MYPPPRLRAGRDPGPVGPRPWDPSPQPPALTPGMGPPPGVISLGRVVGACCGSLHFCFFIKISTPKKIASEGPSMAKVMPKWSKRPPKMSPRRHLFPTFWAKGPHCQNTIIYYV